jgi:hypothetical protein
VSDLGFQKALAIRAERRVRAASFLATAGLVIAVVAFPVLLPFVLLVPLLLLMTPWAAYFSVFTMWAGYYIESCPFCPLVHLEPLEPNAFRCDGCGEAYWELYPVYGPGVKIKTGDEVYCSMECHG